MKIITLTLLLLPGLLASPADAGTRSPSSRVRAVLITASNQPGDKDPRLAAYEPTLRRILRFESFRFVGEASGRLSVPGQVALAPAASHRLELDAEKSDGRRIRLNVRWLHRNRSLMDQPLAVSRGTPSVLGGPASGKRGDVYAIILIAD